jgi:cold shock protein
MSNRETGTVKWFDNAKGYGFIQRPEGEDVFVHYRAIRGEGFRTLQEGQQVNFNIVKGQKGLQAEDVSAE